MKQIYRGVPGAHLLYGVIIVLTTCLLIVGSAYRLKTAEADRLREDLGRAMSDLNTEKRIRQNDEELMISQLDHDRRSIRYLEEGLIIYAYQYPEPPAVKQIRQEANYYGVILPGKK
jgi:hypothetical protein